MTRQNLTDTIDLKQLDDPRLLSGTRVEVDLGALRHNLRVVRERVAPAAVMAMVKANAYGHGLDLVAPVLAEAGVDAFGVAHLQEAILIRQLGIDLPVLVLWPLFPQEYDIAFDAELDLTVVCAEDAEALSNAAQSQGRSVRVHIKVDTGMGRLGIPHMDAVETVARICDLPGLEPVGLYSHFAMVGQPEHEYVRVQLDRFQAVIEGLRTRGCDIAWQHIASTGAVEAIPGAYHTMVRLGLGLFGWSAARQTAAAFPVRPVMSFLSKVRQVRQFAAGESVGYGRTYRITKPTTIAAVSAGYSDGYRREFSNKAYVLIHGVRHRVAGAVCMDWIMVEIQEGTPVRVGDDVVLFGRQGKAEVTVPELCALARTIPYDLLCGVRDRIPRIPVNG